MRELSAKLTVGEKKQENPYHFGEKCNISDFLSLRQNLRFCHLPHQGEAGVLSYI